jgi:hypothetical protein
VFVPILVGGACVQLSHVAPLWIVAGLAVKETWLPPGSPSFSSIMNQDDAQAYPSSLASSAM